MRLNEDAPAVQVGPGPKAPVLLDAILPEAVLIALIALTIVVFASLTSSARSLTSCTGSSVSRFHPPRHGNARRKLAKGNWFHSGRKRVHRHLGVTANASCPSGV
jgi:hypothetical protein